MDLETPPKKIPSQESSNIYNNASTEKLDALKKAIECLNIKDISGTAKHLETAGLFKLSEKLQKFLHEIALGKNIDVALNGVKKMPSEAIGSSGEENFDSMKIAFSPILHESKPMASFIISLGSKDEISIELIKFIALADELHGNYYIANKFYKYVSDTEGQKRTEQLRNKFINDKNYDNQQLYLSNNAQNSKKRLMEAADILEEKTRNFRENLKQIIKETTQEINNEITILKSK